MPLPDFTENGDLPPGLHAASFEEAMSRFGTGSARQRLLKLRLERIYHLAIQTGHLSRLVVFSSFVTNKPEPNDLDVFLIMDDDFNVSQLSGELGILFDHPAADSHFGCSVFWVRQLAALGGEQAAIEHWQIRRDGEFRGIVEITAD